MRCDASKRHAQLLIPATGLYLSKWLKRGGGSLNRARALRAVKGDIIRFQNRTEATKEAGITGADRRLNLPPEMKPAAGRQLRQAAGTVAEGVAPAGEEKFTLLPKEQALIDDLFDFAGMRFRTLKETGNLFYWNIRDTLDACWLGVSFEKKRARYGIIRAGPTPAPQPPLCRKWWCRPGRRDRAYAASQQPTRSRQP